MRWLITGGCGFIGISLITELLRQGGHKIRVLDNLSVGTQEGLAAVSELTVFDGDAVNSCGAIGAHANSTIDLVVADIRDAAPLLSAAEGADVIVHLAGNTGVAPSVADPRSDCEANVMGVLNALEAARGQDVGRFVFASSGAPLGEVVPPIHEEMPPHPVSPYGASKLAGEGYCSAYFRSFGVQTVALRFGNVYGPGSGHKDSVVAKFIRRAMDGEELVVYGDGAQTRDFIYIADLVDAVLRAATKPNIGGEVFQIATNRETSVGEIVTALVETLETAGITGITVRNDAPRQGDVMRNFSDTSKAAKLLDWEPKMALDAGLKTTIEWFVARSETPDA